MSAPKRGLGRGLGALLPGADAGNAPVAGGSQEIELDRIDRNPLQPRMHFDATALEELAASIREHGIVQPVTVRPRGDRYELIAGERRCRAARLAGFDRVPAIIREAEDAEALELALVENLQREDLNPIDEALAYRTAIEELGLTQDELARRVGKSRPAVSNALRLLSLDPEVRERVVLGTVSAGHARALAAVPGGEMQRRLADAIARDGLTVRQVEEIVRRGAHKAGVKAGGQRPARVDGIPEAAYAEFEERLRDRLGTRVSVRGGSRRGRIEIEFYGHEDLERLVHLIAGRDHEAVSRETGED